jgi:uncharacterized paraquat-inducible protein A
MVIWKCGNCGRRFDVMELDGTATILCRRCERENVIAGPSMPWPKLDPRDSRFAGRRYGQR